MTHHSIKGYLLGAVLVAMGFTAVAAIPADLPVRTVNGVKYHTYTVQQHETLYALSKKFNISEAELLRLNPSVADGLKSGQELLLPFVNSAASTALNNTYAVKKQETAYGISKRFNLTLEEFFALNPAARDGVQEGQVVIIKATPATAARTSQPTARQAANTPKVAGTEHIIAEHETLYQIARDNHISLSQLLDANPGLDAARYSAGTKIIIPATKEKAATPAKANAYHVQPGDTFYGIASRHGISVNQLQAANPSVDVLKNGMVINIPDACAENAMAPSATPVQNTQPAVATAKDGITIAVVLPFQLDKKEKHNRSMVEFYRGFLLAVDSMRNIGQPIHILTYDTQATNEGLDAVLAKPELLKAQAIIAPDNSEHLARLNEFGAANRISVFNPFNNRDSAYLTNPYAMQMAIPRDDMYTRAAGAFVDTFVDYIPVFLVSNDGRRDKVEFIDVVRDRLTKTGRQFKEINYTGTLTSELLAQSLDPTKKYAFLPGSSNKDEFDKIAAAMQAYKDTRDFKNEVVVWGYPEWFANRAGYPKMHELDCYIYSRTDFPETYTTERVNNEYERWYGPHMMLNYPRRAYMGFDTGMYLLKALSVNGGDFSKYSPFTSGLLMPLTMKQVPGGGWFNNELLLINLGPVETISKRTI